MRAPVLAAPVVGVAGVGVALVVFGAAVPAAADRGEWSAGLELSGDVAFLVHPAAKRPLSFGTDGGGAFALLPRVSVPMSFGLSNALDVGLAVDVGASASVLARDVVLEGYKADVLTGLYLRAGVPITIAWKLDVGWPVSAGVRVGAGPVVAAFLGNRFVEGDGAGELARTLPVKVDDVFVVGGEVVVGVPVAWRALDWLVVAVEPTVGGSWAGGFGVRAGISLGGRWCGGFGLL